MLTFHRLFFSWNEKFQLMFEVVVPSEKLIIHETTCEKQVVQIVSKNISPFYPGKWIWLGFRVRYITNAWLKNIIQRSKVHFLPFSLCEASLWCLMRYFLFRFASPHRAENIHTSANQMSAVFHGHICLNNQSINSLWCPGWASPTRVFYKKSIVS